MLHRVDLQNNVARSNTMQYFRNAIAYYYLPLLYLDPQKKSMNV